MSLILFVLLIGIANLAAGYAVGQWWGPAPVRRALAAVDLSVFNEMPSPEVGPASALTFELPPLTVDLPPIQTAAAPVARPRTFAEEALAAIDDALHAHREQLMVIDEQMMESQAVESLETTQDCVDALRRANEEYVEAQTPATARLRERESIGKALARPCEDFEYEVEDQTARVEAANRSLAGVRLDYDVDLPATGQQLRGEIARLLDENAAIRDRLCEFALVVADAESNLDSIDSQFTTDRASALPNRAGVQAQLQSWVDGHAQQDRPYSLALFELRGSQEMSLRYGQASVNRLQLALAEDLRSHSSETDVVAQHRGGQFVVFLPDTDRRGATAAVERHRQRVAAMQVNFGAAELSITLTCALTEGRPGDNAQAIWHRLDGALEAAQTADDQAAFGFFADAPEPIAAAEMQVDQSVLNV